MALKLKKIYNQILKEQMPTAPVGPMVSRPMGPPGMGMPPPPMGGMPGGMPGAGGQPPPQVKNIVELADVNTIISLFPMEKKLVFTPQEHSAFTKKLKLYVDVLQQNFMIDSVKILDEGVFELVFDPREDFNSVVQFLQPQQADPNVQQG